MVRGIERKRIFQNDLDREAFLDRLGSLVVETNTPCLARLQKGEALNSIKTLQRMAYSPR